MDKAVSNLDRVIIGIDPGTNMMGYAILGICGNKPHMVAMAGTYLPTRYNAR